MVNKLATNKEGVNKQFKPKIYQKKRRAKQEISVIDITIRIGIAPIAEIEEFSLAVEFSMDKITEVDQGMDKAIRMTLGKEISEAVQEHIKIRISEDRIIEVYIEEFIGIQIMKEVEVGLEKGHI